MKKHSRSFYKKTILNSLFASLFIFIGCVVSIFSFGKDYVVNLNEYYEITSIYNDTEYDYIVKSTINSPVDENFSNQHIKESVFFYNTMASVQINNEDVDIYIRSLVDNEKLDFTEFSSKRILSYKDENSIYITKGFSNTYNLSLNDSIKIAGIEFTITRIYRDNGDSSLVYIPDFDDKIFNKFNKQIEVSGAYIKSLNAQSFETFLKNNKYNYVSKNKNYDVDMSSANNKLATAKKAFNLFSIILGTFYLFGIFAYYIFDLKKLRHEIINNGRKEPTHRLFITHTISILMIIMSVIISCITLNILNNVNISLSDFILKGISGLLILLVITIITIITNYVILKNEKKSL